MTATSVKNCSWRQTVDYTCKTNNNQNNHTNYYSLYDIQQFTEHRRWIGLTDIWVVQITYHREEIFWGYWYTWPSTSHDEALRMPGIQKIPDHHLEDRVSLVLRIPCSHLLEEHHMWRLLVQPPRMSCEDLVELLAKLSHHLLHKKSGRNQQEKIMMCC